MKNVKKKIAIITGAAFLLVAASSTGVYAYYKTPVAYLSLDINPSVELGVNAFDKVVTLEGYNDDGEKIIEGIDVTGSNVTEAVETLIESAADNGYIVEDGSTVISLTSETDNPDIAAEIQNDAEEGANSALEDKDGIAVVQTDNVSLSMNEEARALGITPGKLNLIKKLQTVDPTVTVEQYKDSSVKNIMKTIKNIREQSEVKNKDESGVNNQGEEAVSNQDGSTVDSQGSVSIQDESAEYNQNKGIVTNQKEKIEDDENKSVVNKPEESKINEKNKDEVETNSVIKDKGNKDKNTKSSGNEKRDKVNNSDSNN